VGDYEMRTANVPLKATHGANKWWNRTHDKVNRWNTLEHNGPVFPPPHVAHGVPLVYGTEDMVLSPAAEEVVQQA
jgi:DNA topoisomerase IB